MLVIYVNVYFLIYCFRTSSLSIYGDRSRNPNKFLRSVHPVSLRLQLLLLIIITIQNLFPLYMPKLTDRHIEKTKNYFSKHLDFSDKSNFDAKLTRWRMKHAMEPESEQEGAMPDCSPQEFPAIHKVLLIFLTTPVRNISFKHSSALRHLKLWTRSSMTEDRLSGLAMLLIHRERDFIPTPTEIYDMKSNWRRI